MGYNRAKRKMAKQNKKEEIQSRREFFKNAAKKSLPIVAAAMLASAPVITRAAETSMDCNDACYMGCSWGCTGGCKIDCEGGCKTSCRGTCQNGCSGCKGTCEGSCKGYCGGNCSVSR